MPDDLVLLGTWCLADRIDLTGMNLTKVVVRHPWRDGERLDSDYRRIRDLYDCALRNLREQLNRYHQVELSLRGWEIALGPWLRMFINCVYERYLLVEEAVRNHNVTTVLTIQPELERASHTTLEFQRAVQQDPYWNTKFTTEVAAIAFPELVCSDLSIVEEDADPKVTANGRPRTSVNRISGVLKFLFVLFDELISRHRRVLLHRTGMPWQEEFRLMLKLGLIPHMFLPVLAEQKSSSDGVIRNALGLGLGESRLENVIEQMLRFHIPRIFVEDFSAVHELIQRRYPKRAELIVTGVAYYADDYFKLYTAFATDCGAKYTVLQHGGGFGTPKLNDEEEAIRNTADNFLTWGWSEDNESGRARTIPDASMWLSSLVEVQPKPDGILLMPISEWTLQTFRIFSAPLGFRQLQYLDDVLDFYTRLSPHMAEKFHLRLQPNARDWRIADRLEAAGLGHTILRCRGRFVRDLKDARLAVVNTNSTTLLEALCLNFPTVVILDPEMSPVRAQVQEAFDTLERVGIAYRTPQAAAKFVATIFADPSLWWKEPELQNVRASFVSRFARRDPMFVKGLSKALSLTH